MKFDENRIRASGFIQCSPHHFQRRLPEGILDFWPGPSKFRWQDKTHRGGLVEIEQVLREHFGDKPTLPKQDQPPKRKKDKRIRPEKTQTPRLTSDGVYITIGADCPWNPTPGQRRIFQFATRQDYEIALGNGVQGRMREKPDA